MSDNQPQFGTCDRLKHPLPHAETPSCWSWIALPQPTPAEPRIETDLAQRAKLQARLGNRKAVIDPQDIGAPRLNEEPRIETVPEELCGKVVAQVAGGGVLACDSPRGHVGLCTYTFPFQMTNEPTRSHGPLCDNCGKSSRQHYCWTPVENQEVSTFHPSERRASPPSSPGAAQTPDDFTLSKNSLAREFFDCGYDECTASQKVLIDSRYAQLTRASSPAPQEQK